MLWNLHLFCFVGTFAAAAVLDRRQTPPQGPVVGTGPDGKKQMLGFSFDLEKVAPPMDALSKADLKARFRTNSVRKLTKYGPFTLPPAKVYATAIQNNLVN
jgi:hypothetical protein